MKSSGMIAALLAFAAPAFTSYSRAPISLSFATGARLYKILHYPAPKYYRPKLGKNKRRVRAVKFKRSADNDFMRIMSYQGWI